MMSMPMLPNVNVPVQPSLRIGNTPCPTNMPPPVPTAVPFGERLVNVVRAPVLTAARTLTKTEKKEQDKVVKKELTTYESTLKVAEANQRDDQNMKFQSLRTTRSSRWKTSHCVA
jgi:hypothetical protein